MVSSKDNFPLYSLYRKECGSKQSSYLSHWIVDMFVDVVY